VPIAIEKLKENTAIVQGFIFNVLDFVIRYKIRNATMPKANPELVCNNVSHQKYLL
jgi:hypothetical protein